MKKILFVCMGNICRSPTAEGLFRHALEQRGLAGEIGVDSAGTIGYHAGEPPDRRMSAAARRRGYELRGRARQVQATDFDEFDLVVAMDADNYRDLESLASVRPGQLRMLSEFLEDEWPADVPDPYYGGAQGFEEVLDMIEAACPAMVDEMLELGTD
jgi:protein-tyrosine phosphatase